MAYSALAMPPWEQIMLMYHGSPKLCQRRVPLCLICTHRAAAATHVNQYVQLY